MQITYILSRMVRSKATVDLRAQIRGELGKIGFVPAFGTLGKLVGLKRSSPDVYNGYLRLFSLIRQDLKMPTVVLKLDIPPASLLKEMDVAILIRHIQLIRRNFVDSRAGSLDLRNLPTLWPELPENKPKTA